MHENALSLLITYLYSFANYQGILSVKIYNLKNKKCNNLLTQCSKDQINKLLTTFEVWNNFLK